MGATLYAQKCQLNPAPTRFGPPLSRRKATMPSPNITRGHHSNAAMSFLSRLAREGSTKACNQQCQSFTTLPTSLWEPLPQHNIVKPTPLPPVRKGHNLYAHQAATVSSFPVNLWEPSPRRSNARGTTLPPVLGRYKNAAMSRYCRPILTRGQSNFAAMPFIQRLAIKEIQYG